MNILIKVTYDGTNYHGYQIQNKLKTIEGELSKAINDTLKKETKIYSAGRTDRGVHALGQYVNFYTDTTIDLGNLPRVINFHLPDDISVISAKEVPFDFHARFSAREKIYSYVVYNNKYRNAIYHNRAYQYPFSLDLSLMNESFKYLIGQKDFKSFMGRDAIVKDTIRTIYSIKVKKDNKFIYFDFQGKSFLKNMIRIIMGTAIEIGRGKKDPIFMKEVLEKQNRKYAGPTAPSCGLYLMNILY